ncbi:ATP-dependent Clp protease ATP-binding subunit [Ruminococcaceae bacterium OttesenSCG-928-L11]|nr:ATP-dependent Clp protease ATP-binding subunit [Ruminococcaceae bacterium OttesenSCG-928-L11]
MLHKDLYSEPARIVMQNAFRLGSEMMHGFVGSEHILWSLSRDEGTAAAAVLIGAGLDHEIIRELIEKYDGAGTPDESRIQGLAPDATRVLELAEAQCKKLNHKYMEPEHMLLGILQEQKSVAAKIIVSAGVSLERLTTDVLSRLNKDWPRASETLSDRHSPETKTLDQYSKDLTVAAANDKLDPVIGRETEIGRIIQILSRRTKNNPVLIGEPGVGKTAIAEGLAQRIVKGEVPENLQNKRVVSLDLTKMLSGAKFRGDFEERIKNSIDEAIAAGNIVLFIDELHTLIGAGASEGSMDAANILKPALSRGEIQVIGATTLDEYRKHIEKDAALERRFQSIVVDEPSKEDAVRILHGLKTKYEEHHKLAITDEAIQAAVDMSSRYIQDRYLPDKAIDLVDEACSRVRTQNLTTPPHLRDLEARVNVLNIEKAEAVRTQDFERAAQIRDYQKTLRTEFETARDQWRKARAGKVVGEDIATVVSAWTGIPVTMLTQDESERLLHLEEVLHNRVIGQDEAVTAVSKAIRRGRVGLKDPKRPMGTFLFLGPTGVGKTELCKALAEAMFQDETAMLRVDMSEYMERHAVSKLIGSPPGYVGYDEGGQLTEKIRRKPYSVVLFDEIEKAHDDVFNILLQIMEDGVLTDSQGRRVDFKHAIIVMTSNLGARSITDKRKSLGFASLGEGSDTASQQEIREKVMEELKRAFKPEFLNRLDDTIVFHQLDKAQIRQIADNMIRQLSQRMEDLSITLSVDDAALDLLAEKGFDPVYGARPLRREIQARIEDPAAEKILERGLINGGTIRVTAVDGDIHLEATAPEPSTEAAPAPTVEEPAPAL